MFKKIRKRDLRARQKPLGSLLQTEKSGNTFHYFSEEEQSVDGVLILVNKNTICQNNTSHINGVIYLIFQPYSWYSLKIAEVSTPTLNHNPEEVDLFNYLMTKQDCIYFTIICGDFYAKIRIKIDPSESDGNSDRKMQNFIDLCFEKQPIFYEYFLLEVTSQKIGGKNLGLQNT